MRTALLAAAVVASAFVGGLQAQEVLDLSISGGAIFAKSVSPSTSNVSLSPHGSALALGSVRYHFNHLHAVEFNVAHANTADTFTKPPDTYKFTGSVLEFSGAYVLTPFHDHKIQPFLFAGLGGLHWTVQTQYIDTVTATLGAGPQNSLAFLYGGGADYRLWKRLGLRVQYRGLIYRAPDFGVSTLFVSGRDHMAEPTVGLVIKF